MTLRTAWWKPGNQFGFNMKKATADRLVAEIYTRAPWMQLQESGGTKSPKGRHLAIPTTNVRRTKRDLISKPQRPQALGSKAFHIKTKAGAEMLAMRIGRGKNKGLRFMYVLSKQASVKPLLHFHEQISKFVMANANGYMIKAIDKLIG